MQVGGLSVAVTGLAEELAAEGNEVHYFTRRAPGQAQHMTINGVEYNTFAVDPGPSACAFAHNMSMAMLEGLRQIERHLGRFDLVHGHDWLVVDALHELKNQGYPVVLTYHSTEYGRNGGAFGDWPEFREISGKEWYGGYMADRVATVSKSMKEELGRLYNVPEWKVDVVPNGIKPERYRLNVDPGRVKQRYGIHPLAPVVMFIGRLESQKGPDILLEAVPKVVKDRWDAVFLFIGQGSMKSYLQSRAEELGVGRAARFLGFVPHWDFLELLNSCDLVCLPSRNEPFGITLLEAWSVGKPVVAADVGGLAENVDNFVNGVKVYASPDSVAWGIKYLLDSPERMQRIGEEGARKVKEFSWQKAASLLVGTYAKAMASSSPAGPDPAPEA